MKSIITATLLLGSSALAQSANTWVQYDSVDALKYVLVKELPNSYVVNEYHHSLTTDPLGSYEFSKKTGLLIDGGNVKTCKTVSFIQKAGSVVFVNPCLGTTPVHSQFILNPSNVCK